MNSIKLNKRQNDDEDSSSDYVDEDKSSTTDDDNEYVSETPLKDENKDENKDDKNDKNENDKSDRHKNKKIKKDNNEEIEIFDDKLDDKFMEDLLKSGIFGLTNGFIIRTGGSKKRKHEESLYEKLENFGESNIESLKKYIQNLEPGEEEEYKKRIDEIDLLRKSSIPNAIKVLNWDTTQNNKSTALKMLAEYSKSSDEPRKLGRAINKLMMVPFGKIVGPKVNKNSSFPEINKYLKEMRKLLDKNIYGHDVTKTQLLEIVAQTISNPKEGGNVFCMVGSPGVGKTDLIKNAVAKSLNRPFHLISLGGASDGSTLNGHGYTYTGSQCGRIVDALSSTQCMNPILFFDELDKVSHTDKGNEIINILIHLTDPTQNNCFYDNYFPGMEFDLSKAIIIFSLNDLSHVSPILRDRMKIINVDGYDLNDKYKIIENYIMPKLSSEYGLENVDITIDRKTIKYLIEKYTNEKGVRKIKELLKDIYSKINYKRYTSNVKKFTVSMDFLNTEILKHKHKIENTPLQFENSVAKVHGLWASDNIMIGGVLPICCNFFPTTNYYTVETSGLVGKMMTESVKLAKIVAWNLLTEDMKKKYIEKWEKTPEGIHITFSCLSTEIDGPSATTIITLCIYSLLANVKINNYYAVTGEMDMIGNVKKIGGLKEKILGAKQEGIKHVLCPYENKEDLDKILSKIGRAHV